MTTEVETDGNYLAARQALINHVGASIRHEVKLREAVSSVSRSNAPDRKRSVILDRAARTIPGAILARFLGRRATRQPDLLRRFSVEQESPSDQVSSSQLLKAASPVSGREQASLNELQTEVEVLPHS